MTNNVNSTRVSHLNEHELSILTNRGILQDPTTGRFYRFEAVEKNGQRKDANNLCIQEKERISRVITCVLAHSGAIRKAGEKLLILVRQRRGQPQVEIVQKAAGARLAVDRVICNTSIREAIRNIGNISATASKSILQDFSSTYTLSIVPDDDEGLNIRPESNFRLSDEARKVAAQHSERGLVPPGTLESDIYRPITRRYTSQKASVVYGEEVIERTATVRRAIISLTKTIERLRGLEKELVNASEASGNEGVGAQRRLRQVRGDLAHFERQHQLATTYLRENKDWLDTNYWRYTIAECYDFDEAIQKQLYISGAVNMRYHSLNDRNGQRVGGFAQVGAISDMRNGWTSLPDLERMQREVAAGNFDLVRQRLSEIVSQFMRSGTFRGPIDKSLRKELKTYVLPALLQLAHGGTWTNARVLQLKSLMQVLNRKLSVRIDELGKKYESLRHQYTSLVQEYDNLKARRENLERQTSSPERNAELSAVNKKMKKMEKKLGKIASKIAKIRKKRDKMQSGRQALRQLVTIQSNNTSEVNSIIADRERMLNDQMLQLVAEQVQRNPQALQNGNFRMIHVSLVNGLKKPKLTTSGWMSYEHCQIADMNAVFDRFNGKTIVFDDTRGPSLDGNVIYLPRPSGLSMAALPPTVSLETYLFNIAPQGNTANKGIQLIVNQNTAQRLIKSYASAGETLPSQLHKMVQKLSSNKTNGGYLLAEETMIAVMNARVPLSCGCQSAKDRTGLVGGRVIQRMMQSLPGNEEIDPSRRGRNPFLNNLLAPGKPGSRNPSAEVIFENTGVRSLKVIPWKSVVKIKLFFSALFRGIFCFFKPSFEAQWQHSRILKDRVRYIPRSHAPALSAT